MTDISPEEAAREAAHAARDAEYARNIAREALMEQHLSVDKMADAFRKVLSDGIDGKQRVILLKRIPIICNDILQMKGDLQWLKWIGMTIVGLIAAQTISKIFI